MCGRQIDSREILSANKQHRYVTNPYASRSRTTLENYLEGDFIFDRTACTFTLPFTFE